MTEKKTVKPAAGEIVGVRVRSIPERRCRAGMCFDRDGQVFDPDDLSQEQVEALVADPLLKVEPVTAADNQPAE